MKHRDEEKNVFERVTTWIGSSTSFTVHTILFVASFSIGVFNLATWDHVLLVLTTALSLEAIYLSIFIQMSVNRHAKELEEVSEDIEDIQEDMEEVSEDIDEIQEDVDEIQKDVDEIQEDVDEIQEDVEEIQEETEQTAARAPKRSRRKKGTATTLDELTESVRKILEELEALKNSQ